MNIRFLSGLRKQTNNIFGIQIEYALFTIAINTDWIWLSATCLRRNSYRKYARRKGRRD